MARTRASISTSIWSDPDFIALSGQAKLLYFCLLAQPGLTLAGCLDYMPTRWEGFNLATDDIDLVVKELEEARFVVVDRTTLELVIRTFTKHDLGNGNQNVVKGMWSAWSSILSPTLRTVVVTNVPESIWEHETAVPPASARALLASQNGRSNGRPVARSEPVEADVGTGDSEPRKLPPPSPPPSPPTDARSPKEAATEAFDCSWWPAYPRKEAKQDARKAYLSVTTAGRVSERADHDALLGALERQVEVWLREGRPTDKVPYAATWLRGRRWEDEKLRDAAVVDEFNPQGTEFR